MQRPHETAVPAEAYMLADHLDAALAAGEDILTAGRRLANAGTAACSQDDLRSAVESVRALELALITRVLKAREWSQRFCKADARFKLQAMSFMGGSSALVDALAQFADATNADFDTGDGMTAYFRSRGVIDAEAAALSDKAQTLICETFLVSGRIELGALLDMIASYLDALEVHFLLFGGSEGGTERPAQASQSVNLSAAPSL